MPTEVVPFVASVAFAVLGAIATFAVGRQAPSYIAKLDKKYAQAQPPADDEGDGRAAPTRSEDVATPSIPPHRSADAIGRICIWAADCVQSSIVLAGPVVSALLLAQIATPLLGLAYVGVGVLGAGVFIWLLFADPDRYTQRTWLFLTPVAGLAIGVNALLAAIVWIAVA